MTVKRINPKKIKFKEYPISKLVGLHTLPNPNVKRDFEVNKHITDLKNKIYLNGYDCTYPISVHPLKEKDKGLIMAGHHRAVAMYLLGEKTIPARIWDSLPENIWEFEPYKYFKDKDRVNQNEVKLDVCAIQ